MTHATAVVLSRPEALELRRVDLEEPGPGDVVVDVEWSGISTGTERLLWSGDMPDFPGMGYPLIPGYESVGRVIGPGGHRLDGARVYVPGARCFKDVRGLFGGAASRLVVPAERVVPVDASLGERGILLALAATAHHALAAPGARVPELVVGHGVLGRLLARVTVALGNAAPTVWERAGARAEGAGGYRVVSPEDDDRHDYRAIYDASGDPSVIDSLLARLAPRSGAEVVLAGFYSAPLRIDHTLAFTREARLRIAAEWEPEDLSAVARLVADGRLPLDGLISHRREADRAEEAYRTAFADPHCLKMVLDWRHCS